MRINKEIKNKSNEAPASFTTITLRISTPVLEKLRNESEGKSSSLNAAINQILKHYVEWDAFESQFGMIPFPRTVICKIFKEMSEEQIIELATNTGKNAAIDAAILMKGRIDVTDFISWIETRMKDSGSQVIHRLNDNNEHTIIIRHDLGSHWSLYLKALLASTLTDIFRIQANGIIATDTVFSLRFKKKDG
jgi:hypothetical protein